MSDEKKSLRLDFGNLPLVEAALRASFSQPLILTYNMVNAIHSSIKNEFPALSEPKHFEHRPGLPDSIELGPGQLPGALFCGNQGISISLQNQVVVVRWTRYLSATESSYPRYATLRKVLENSLAALRRHHGAVAASDGYPEISVINMSYVNFIRVPHSEPILKRYFSPEARLQCATDAPMLHQIEASWRTEAEHDLRFRLHRISVKVDDAEVEGFELTTVSGRKVAVPKKALDDLDDVHDQLQHFFLKLISEEARDEWQLRSVSDA